ncbi:MAG: hypothetical protein ACOCY0_00625 [Roseicyclus sp.]
MLARGWDITAQVALVLVLGLAVAFGAAAALALAKFTEALEDTVAARYAVHASDLRTAIETGINLGLDVAAIADNVERVVEDRIDLDTGILQVIVAGRDGASVLSVERPDRMAAVPERGVAAAVLPIRNSFGGTEGSVTVRYASALEGGAVGSVAILLAGDVALVTLVAALTTTLACIFFVRPLRRTLRRAADILATPREAPLPVAPPSGAPLEMAACRAATEARETLRALSEIEAQLSEAGGGHGRGAT